MQIQPGDGTGNTIIIIPARAFPAHSSAPVGMGTKKPSDRFGRNLFSTILRLHGLSSPYVLTQAGSEMGRGSERGSITVNREYPSLQNTANVGVLLLNLLEV